VKPAINISLTAVAFALSAPLAALAQVTYSYTGAKYDQVSVSLYQWGEDHAVTDARAAAAAAALRDQQLTFSFTAPVFLPAGWSTFSTTGGYTGALLNSMTAFEQQHGVNNPAVTWSADSALWAESGNVALHFDPASFDPDWDSRLSVSLHADANNVIDAWQFSVQPGPAMYWTYYYSLGMTGSSADGDRSDLAGSYPRCCWDVRQAATTTAGSWTRTGSPVLAVPEPATCAMLLAGLGLIGLTRRRKHFDIAR
jgi:hypothetical protein